jgi:hypothetical protein
MRDLSAYRNDTAVPGAMPPGRPGGYPAATWRAWLTATGTLDGLEPVAAAALAAIDPDVAIAVMDLGPVAGTALLEPVIGRCRTVAPVRGAA